MILPSLEECPHCGREYYPKSNTQTTCGARDCRVKETRDKAQASHWQNKKQVADNARRESQKDKTQMDTFRQAVMDRMRSNEGYVHCQKCGCASGGLVRLEVHHIVYRSELRGNPKRNDKRNLILVCRTCHEGFHNHKKSRQYLIDERALYELFPGVVRKSD